MTWSAAARAALRNRVGRLVRRCKIRGPRRARATWSSRKLRRARLDAGVKSQRDLARLTGIRLWRIQAIEAEKQEPRAAELRALASALGVTMEEIA